LVVESVGLSVGPSVYCTQQPIGTSGIQLSYSGIQLSYSGIQLSYSGIQLSYSGIQLSYNINMMYVILKTDVA
jgi:hypothetical protein